MLSFCLFFSSYGLLMNYLHFQLMKVPPNSVMRNWHQVQATEQQYLQDPMG